MQNFFFEHFFTSLTYDVAEKERINFCIWSPNARSIIYVQENDVYYVANTAAPSVVRLTTDGVDNEIYNGVPDWVYEG